MKKLVIKLNDDLYEQLITEMHYADEKFIRQFMLGIIYKYILSKKEDKR